MVGSPDYKVGACDLGTHPDRVVPLNRGPPWPRTQVYNFQDEGDLEARLSVMRRTARQMADVLGAEGVEEDDVPKVWVATQSQDWISAGAEVSQPLISDDTRFQNLGACGLVLSPTGSEPVITQRMTMEEKAEFVRTFELDLRVLGDNRNQGGRRYLRFQDAVALLRETEFEDRPHLGSRATKEFLTSIRDGSGNLEKCHFVRVSPAVHQLRPCGCEQPGRGGADRASHHPGRARRLEEPKSMRITLAWSSCSTKLPTCLERPLRRNLIAVYPDPAR